MNNRESSQHHPEARSQSGDAVPYVRGDRDHFLRLMFFQASHHVSPQPPAYPQREPGAYSALRLWKAKSDTGYHLPLSTATAPVSLESPALEVMTDLRHVPAVTIGHFGTVDDANRTMIERGVRALFVVDDMRRVLGIITATDVLGEKPVQLTHQRGIHHNEVIVRDVMTPADRLEVIDLEEVRHGRVGDVIATLRLSGRQHALAVEITGDAATGTQQNVRGIFSLTQIARQLGIPPQPLHDIGRTFAEIEAAIAS
ncbi:MAG: CBS domain-containing protein [Betaproteobacteria bacterium]